MRRVSLSRIKIVDPLNFSASTTGGSYIDLQFHLFQTDGTGLLNNDDWDGVRPRLGSGVPVNGSIDWSVWAQANLPAGHYLLAISYWPRDPRNGAGQDIWSETPWSQQRTLMDQELPALSLAGIVRPGWIRTITSFWQVSNMLLCLSQRA